LAVRNGVSATDVFRQLTLPERYLEDLVGAEVGTATALVVSLPRKRGSRYVATGVLIFAGQAGVRVYAL